MPKVFDLELDRLEEYRLEQDADLVEEDPDEDTMMEFLAYMNERTGAGGARIATAFGIERRKIKYEKENPENPYRRYEPE